MKHATMNRIFRLVWNTALGAWVAVAENCRGAGKGGSARRKVLALAALLALASPLTHAADAANAAVTAGTGSVSTSGGVTTINQASARMAIDWSKLSTSANEALVFKQPGASSIALNRVTGTDPSQLLGSLTANGQVFVLNPNGVMFGAGSQVNVGGLVASTLGLSNDDLMAGKFSFSNGGTGGSIVNKGTITAGSGGYITLLAPEVRNEGVMTARLGTALLAAGNKVTLNLDNGSLLGYSIDQGAVKALAENGGLIKADGGQVLLTAKALDALTTGTVNNTGFIEAQTVENRSGRIVLLGDMQTGTANVAGTLDASAPNGGDGGFIETSAFHVVTDESAKITTRSAQGRHGTLLIDPDTFTVNNGGANSGTGTNSFYSNTYLSSLLDNNDVIIEVTGGSRTITVNGAVNWSEATTLSLLTNTAYGSSPAGKININQPITASAGGVKLQTYGDITVPAAINVKVLTLNGGNWRQVGATLPQFNVTDFRLGPQPYGGGGISFIRALGGDGSTGNPYQLTDIYGVQGMSRNGGAFNFMLANDIDASGASAWSNGAGFGAISNFSGIFDGRGRTISGLTQKLPSTDTSGGMFASNTGTLRNFGLVNASIRGAFYVGGIASLNQGLIENVFVTGNVSGPTDASDVIGGLVGQNYGTIRNSYSAASVSGGNDIGGLVGEHLGGLITSSYATGNLSGYDEVAGLVARSSAAITNSYSTSRITGHYIYGLVGINNGPAPVNSYWQTGNGALVSDGGTAKTAAQMMQASTFASWDLSTTGDPAAPTVWRIYEGHTAPLLRSFLTPLALSGTVTYNGSAQTLATGANISGSGATGTNAGTYTGDYWSNQRGYDLTGGTLTIDKRALAITGGREYNGLDAISWSDLVLGNLVAGESLVLGGSGTLGNRNAGTGRTVNTSGLSLANGSGLASNYMLTGGTYTADVYQRKLDINGGRVYDGTTVVTAPGNLTLGNLVTGETLNLAGSATLDNKNAGTHTSLGTGGLTLSNGSGAASNYTLAGGNQQAVITPRSLTVTAAGQDKVYDGNTDANVTYGSNMIGGDMLSFSSVSQQFNDRNAGARTILVSGISAGGTDAANYSLGNTTASASANITARSLSVSGSRAYDGTATLDAATGNLVLGNLVQGESFELGGAATLASKNAGTYTTLGTGGLVLANGTGGAAAGNYTFTGGTQSAVIAQRVLGVTTTGVDKVYDGGTAAGVTYSSDKVANDDVAFSSATREFAGKNVGSGIAIAVNGIAISGNDAGNYVLASDASATSANITPRTLNVSTAGQDKVYDGGTAATVAYSSDKLGNDDLSFTSASREFASRNVANGIAIAVSGISIGGNDAGNYVLASDASATSANITPRTLNVSTTGVNKVYDGGTAATVTYGSDKVAGDDLTFASTSREFASRNVGTGIGITVSGITAGGTDAGNYVLAGTASATSADITARTLNVSTTGINKVYDGGTAAAVTYASDKVAGDQVDIGSLARTFSEKNVGQRAISVTGLSLDGADAGNYVLASTSSATSANITARTLNVTTAGQDKVYDGTTGAVVSYASDQVAGDMVVLNGTAAFASKNAGNRAISVTGITASGTDAGNYVLAANTSSTQANITARPLTATANNDQKAFDGLPYSGGNGVSYSGFVAGDGASDIAGTPVYGGSSQGAFQTGAYDITVSGLASVSGNYALGYAGGSLLITSTGFLNFQGIPSLINLYDCDVQAVAGLGGKLDTAGQGCRATSTVEAMAARLAAAAADRDQ
ncbi:MAG: filamentous hemagglutinin N-terminal domain-containing protein [Comamonadaceae bacterium]|nr:MAG: filamentous hemagglutinin N-terminal domain-containing protein [Comamonadaceae bacterium]